MQQTENDILKRVRKIEIKTRGLSNEIFAGKYHTAFRGRGMSFSEVREYRAGDDVRDIDWNVTARSRKPHIKIYEEERELTIFDEDELAPYRAQLEQELAAEDLLFQRDRTEAS